ncbi:polysaccharide deacetylase [Saccharothrix sp. S26]|uniref:polysaccharide deacetylase n=1 Tax=Saccharothrix sp. S26 TaxID=2907215 RepID=UPI001F38BC1B|nr:polysaccharide deacetylase [Saccharothrix sp. S26]MCE6994442.1 polysaccharide deacetylase [Saccharothrix sp. S26]
MVVKRWGWLSTGVALALTLVVLAVLGAREPGPGNDVGDLAAPLPMAPRTSGSTSAAAAPTVPASASPPAWMRRMLPGEKPPQFVLFSFDGAASKPHWDRIMPIAERVNAHVTGLLSGVYLVPDDEGATYTGPGHRSGYSSIGFGGSRADVALRIGYLNAAIDAGHEIGTHYNGHFCVGDEPNVGTWSTEQWNRELDQFFAIVEKARRQGFKLDPAAVRGGRTPCLEGDWPQAFPAMRGHGLAYDTSHVSLGVVWPYVHEGLWEFPMPEVRVPALGKQVVMMDFNLWYALNGAKEEPEKAADYTRIVLDTYRSVHQAAVNGNRAPIVIGNHFNEWAGGAFSNAVESFLGEVCVKPETVCATYTEVIQWMQLQDPVVLEQLRRMPAARN